MDRAYAEILAIALLAAVGIGVYGTILCRTGLEDPLMRPLAPPPLDQYLDGWGLLHFALYATLAFLYPELRLLAYIMVLGVLWEVVEFYLHHRPLYFTRRCANGKGTFWYSRWQDIIMNALGASAGFGLAWLIKH